MSFVVRAAERKKAKLRVALMGPSGSGKTYTSVKIAKGLGEKTVVIDTEQHRADLCADIMPFGIIDLGEPYSPERYIEALKVAEESGAGTIIVDSLTHEWSGIGGVLEIQAQLANSPKMNSFMAWAKVTPRHRALIEALLRSPAHIIVTMRTKTKWVVNEEAGRSKPERVGLDPVQKDDIEYEFIVSFLMDHEHNAYPVTDHTGLFDSSTVLNKPGEELGERLLAWLNSASDPEQLAEYRTQMRQRIIDSGKSWEEYRADMIASGVELPEAAPSMWRLDDYVAVLNALKARES